MKRKRREPTTQEPWPEQKARLEAQARKEWDTDENTGTCNLCNKPMRLHPVGRMLVADPIYCPKDEPIDRDVSSVDPTPRRDGVPDDGLAPCACHPSKGEVCGYHAYGENADSAPTAVSVVDASHDPNVVRLVELGEQFIGFLEADSSHLVKDVDEAINEWRSLTLVRRSDVESGAGNTAVSLKNTAVSLTGPPDNAYEGDVSLTPGDEPSPDWNLNERAAEWREAFEAQESGTDLYAPSIPRQGCDEFGDHPDHLWTASDGKEVLCAGVRVQAPGHDVGAGPVKDADDYYAREAEKRGYEAGVKAVEKAVQDIWAHATPYGEDVDGSITHYLMPTGALHRAMGAIGGNTVPPCPSCTSAGAGHTDTICLTGSTRFWDEYQELFRAFSLQGKIVLTVAFPTHQGGSEVTPEQKRTLDELHLRKIDAADCVYVINVDGYIGESTANEIEYAEATGKRVYYHETPCAPGDTEVAGREGAT